MIFNNWGLGIGDWGLGPIPNPQSPIYQQYNKKNIILVYKMNYILKQKNFIKSIWIL